MSDNAVGKRVAPVCLGIRLLTVASGFSEKASSSLGWMPAKGGREGGRDNEPLGPDTKEIVFALRMEYVHIKTSGNQ